MSANSNTHADASRAAIQWGFFEAEFPGGGNTPAIPGRTLGDLSAWQSLLETVAGKQNTDKLAVAASQFTKWYCRSCLGILHAFSMEDKIACASLDDLILLFPKAPPFALGTCRPSVPMDRHSSRAALRELVLTQLFAENYHKMFEAISHITHLRLSILWENASVYIHYFYRTHMEQIEDGGRRNILREDYEFIMKHADPILFGTNHKENPFDGTGGPVRNTCCLRYMLPGCAACSTCPSPAAQAGKA